MIISNKKNSVVLALAATSFFSLSRTEAALVTFSDDGENTTISWSGEFDNTGLSLIRILAEDVAGATATISSDNILGSDSDVLLLSGESGNLFITTSSFPLTVSSGWTDPSGKFQDSVIGGGSLEGSLFFNSATRQVGWSFTDSGSTTITGTLSDNGFTAGESLVFTNSNVVNNNTLTIQTVASVPEPTSIALLGLGTLGFIARRRRA